MEIEEHIKVEIDDEEGFRLSGLLGVPCPIVNPKTDEIVGVARNNSKNGEVEIELW